jgi:tetratricopeptide (TPR) repeat protein
MATRGYPLPTVLLRDHGDYAGAQPLFERALAIHEKAFGPQHPGTAWSLTHLAVVLQAQADYWRARPLCERALAIREKALGSDHPDTGTTLHLLAQLLRDQSDLAGARPLCERALAIREKALGPNHPHTAWSPQTRGTPNLIEKCSSRSRADRFGRLALFGACARASGAPYSDRGSPCGQMQKSATWKFHNLPPPSKIRGLGCRRPAKQFLFDHLVGADKQSGRKSEADCQSSSAIRLYLKVTRGDLLMGTNMPLLGVDC